MSLRYFLQNEICENMYFFSYFKDNFLTDFSKLKASLLKPIIAINRFKLIGINLIGILIHSKKS